MRIDVEGYAAEFTAKDIKDMGRIELRRYRSTIGRLTPGERKDLREWVAAGNSVHNNPYCLYGDNGWPLDYITAVRINEDMCRNPEDYGIGAEPEPYLDPEDDGLPF